jgi:hypothetical protein
MTNHPAARAGSKEESNHTFQGVRMHAPQTPQTPLKLGSIPKPFRLPRGQVLACTEGCLWITSDALAGLPRQRHRAGARPVLCHAAGRDLFCGRPARLRRAGFFTHAPQGRGDYMLIETERHGRHVGAHLNRPEKLNALSYELIDELMDRLNALERDDSVRCLVLTGRGE